jgi:hypothetical protein
MKKLIFISTLLFGILTSFGQVQAKKKDIDKDANVLMDSLSKVHHVRVLSIMVVTQNDVRTTSIAFAKNKELVYKVIKTEYIK